MANRRNGPVTPGLWRFWGCQGPQRFTLIPLIPALPGWELWFTTPRQTEATKLCVASADPEQKRHVYTCLGSPLPVVVLVVATSIITIIACFVRTSYILLHSTFKYRLLVGGWKTQDMLQSFAINPCEVLSFGAGFGLWFSPSPLQLVQLARWESKIHAYCPGGCIREERLWTSCCTLNFWFGNTLCGFVRYL